MKGERVMFSPFEYSDYIAVLLSMIDLEENLSPEIERELIIKGFHGAAKNKKIDKASVLAEINRAIVEYNQKPVRPYKLVSTISIDRSCSLKSHAIGSSVISYHSTLPERYKSSRRDALREVSDWLTNRDEPSSMYIVARTLAKSDYDAVDQLLGDIDFMRGSFNLLLNNIKTISLCGRKSPINKIVLGCLQTLHDDHGLLASSTYWYQPVHVKKYSPYNISSDSNRIVKLASKLRYRISRSLLRSELITAIIRYARALDSQGDNVTFLQLWSLLEYLTSTLRDGYDKTIRRTLFLFNDHEYNKQVLEHLRQYRNKSVHSGGTEGEIEPHIYQLKRYVEILLWFHIENSFRFRSLAEAAELLDLPYSKETLKSKLTLYGSGNKLTRI